MIHNQLTISYVCNLCIIMFKFWLDNGGLARHLLHAAKAVSASDAASKAQVAVVLAVVAALEPLFI